MARALGLYVPIASIAARAVAITPGAAAGAATITAIPTIGPWDTASRGAASERQAAWGEVERINRILGICPSDPSIRVRRLAVGLALILVAIGLPRSPALAEDASALIGHWLVPSREQKKSRMSPHCQRYAETDVQTVPESEIEIFSCDDPAFAPEKTRILEFVKSVNEVYRAQNRPLYSETPSGLCAVVRETAARRKTDLCNPSEELRGAAIENLPVVWNIRSSGNNEWPLMGDSYSPSSGYGAISCFKKPASDQVITKGCAGGASSCR